ncbi:hypothetical protein Tco_1080088 [Tanacetum coccineum]|uniref:Uncharacterized protein n=1 Tax=Tanacetum coccineum TaxID=301880 RepID=A0ABQ5HTR5_9ASTR
MATHNRIYIAPSHTKKIFTNMKRQGKEFSGRVTSLFLTMVVQAQEEMGEGQDMAEKEVSTADPVTTAGKVVTTANVEVSTASLTVATITNVELTLAQTLAELKSQKVDDDQEAAKIEKELMKIVLMMRSCFEALAWKYLETLWKLVKAKHGYTRPEEGYERVIWGDLKTMSTLVRFKVTVLYGDSEEFSLHTCYNPKLLNRGSGVDVDTAYPRYWIRRIQGIGYGVSKVLDMAYWGFLE